MCVSVSGPAVVEGEGQVEEDPVQGGLGGGMLFNNKVEVLQIQKGASMSDNHISLSRQGNAVNAQK